MKQARFHPRAREIIRELPKDVRQELGEGITDLQKGFNLEMPLSRPMPSVAPGVHELRVGDRNGVYRVFYFLKIKDAVLIFHAFQKKTQKTLEREIELGRKRLKEML